MNISNLDNSLEFQDILKDNKVLSRIFNGWDKVKENNLILKSDLLSIWKYKPSISNWLKIDNYIFNEYHNLSLNSKSKCDSINILILNNTNIGIQVLFGYYHDRFVFLDISERTLFFVKFTDLKNYLSIFIKSKETLFNPEFILYKEKIKELNKSTNYYFYTVDYKE